MPGCVDIDNPSFKWNCRRSTFLHKDQQGRPYRVKDFSAIGAIWRAEYFGVELSVSRISTTVNTM